MFVVARPSANSARPHVGADTLTVSLDILAERHRTLNVVLSSWGRERGQRRVRYASFGSFLVTVIVLQDIFVGPTRAQQGSLGATFFDHQRCVGQSKC